MSTSQKNNNQIEDSAKDELSQQGKLSKDYIAYLRQLTGSWSSYSAARMLNRELINYLVPRFYRCSVTLKVRILISLLYVSPHIIEECRLPLSELLNDCEAESDDWVRKLSRLLQPYVATGHIDIREIDTEVAYRTMKFLDENKQKMGKAYRLKPPLEYPRIFDISEDAWPPHEDSDASKSECPYPSSIGSVLASLPQYKSEVNHFTAGGDFSLFMREVETQGLAALSREIKNLENQKTRRRQQTSPRR